MAKPLTPKRAEGPIRFSAKLAQPATEGAAPSWLFLLLPKAASEQLPSRGMVSIEGTIRGVPFCATLDPDGQGSHWLKVEAKLQADAGLSVDETVELVIRPAAVEPEPTVPEDLRIALVAAPKAQELWLKITAVARRDWIQWIESARQPATRVRRITNACSMLAAGKKRVCCFDRSGIFSQGLAAPKPVR